jgi:hypothetical protein
MTNAISMRNATDAAGWRTMELHRARFIIQQDPDFQAGRPSSPEQQARIENDLRIAEADPAVNLLVAQYVEVTTWRQLQRAATSPPPPPPPPPDNP